MKIDQSIIHNLPGKPNDAVVAQVIITMAQSLGLELIAEGVETAAQQQFLDRHGGPTCQGYLFSKPIPLGGFVTLLQRWTA